MSYRRKDKQERNEWMAWRREHADLITAAGLPEVVLCDREHWLDFVDHCFLDHHDDPSKFDIDQLTVRQKASLLRLLLTGRSLNENPLTTVLGGALVWDLMEAVEEAYRE